MPIDRLREGVRNRTERYERDIGHALRGDFGRISEDTRREIAEALKDHMEGRTRVVLPINERVSIEGRRERDGSISVGMKIDF